MVKSDEKVKKTTASAVRKTDDKSVGTNKDNKPVKSSKVNDKEMKHGVNQSNLNTPPETVKTGKEPEEVAVTAKAGKRSAKAIKEQQEKLAKEERKASNHEQDTVKPKASSKPVRSRLERRGKAYRKVSELIDSSKLYSLSEAIVLAIKTNPAKFDATVEMHIRLGVDPKQADQNIRETVVLPAGSGKTVRVAVFADEDGIKAAQQAGADIASGDEFLQILERGEIEFDTLIATPALMPKLGKYARQLGPKGLMPNPKSGTVTNDVAKAVREAKTGRLEYRVDSTGIVHVPIGKISFGDKALLENATAITDSIKAAKPTTIKGTYLLSAYATTTMGPSIAIDTTRLS